ncbi:hypothetical protein MAPG_09419 [Magnaporthiopsis poae ATCC 64411]|uniref:Uncharacterized protein n=1 Tax=Magnaporthiopsis poae (strain ATCC 64411 / 73-15) TaxID=644358 RepID=A0A0C4E9W9_MAGP6|nr:hypothetical protein MAPG_09419 [Magnaporthiopsis poae ATCC 64411]
MTTRPGGLFLDLGGYSTQQPAVLWRNRDNAWPAHIAQMAVTRPGGLFLVMGGCSTQQPTGLWRNHGNAWPAYMAEMAVVGRHMYTRDLFPGWQPNNYMPEAATHTLAQIIIK